MKNTKKHLITVIKLALIAALLTYVGSRIQWRDSLTITTQGQDKLTYQGEIQGHWNKFPVEFIKDDGISVRIESQEQALSQQISPGFFTYLKKTQPGWLAVGCIAFVLIVMFSALRWHWLVNTLHMRLGLGQAIRLTWIGLFFNNFVPGQTGGDLVKAYYIAKNSPQKRLSAVLTVIVDRIIGLSALIIISLVTTTLFFDRFKEIAILLWFGILLCIALAIILFSRKIRRALGLSNLVKKLPEKIFRPIYQLDTALSQYTNHKAGIIIWWFLSLGNHLVSIYGIYALSRSINMGVPITEFFALIPVIFIVSAVPIAPNGWGIGEALFGNLFSQYGAVYLPNIDNADQVMHTRGVALSILYRILSMCLSLIGGLFLLFSKEKIPTATSTRTD